MTETPLTDLDRTCCDDCALCQGDPVPTHDEALRRRLGDRLDRPCRSCSHAVVAHRLAAARAALPGVQIATRPTPGSPLDRLQALGRAEKAGLLTRQEVKDATRRLIRRAMRD